MLAGAQRMIQHLREKLEEKRLKEIRDRKLMEGLQEKFKKRISALQAASKRRISELEAENARLQKGFEMLGVKLPRKLPENASRLMEVQRKLRELNQKLDDKLDQVNQ